MNIPNCATESSGQLSAPLTVTLDWLPAKPDGTFIAPSADTAEQLSVNADLPRSRSCLSNLGVFDTTFQVIKYSGPGSAAAGSIYLPAVNWYVRNAIRNTNLLRVYALTSDATQQVYTCEGPTRLGEYPIYMWHRGETIYFDQYALSVPPDALPGEYTLSVGLWDMDAGHYLPFTPGQGDVSAHGLLNVTKLTVR